MLDAVKPDIGHENAQTHQTNGESDAWDLALSPALCMQAQIAKKIIACLACGGVPAEEEEPDADVDGFVFFQSILFPNSADVSSFVGLRVTPEYVLIVTGAHHGVM